MVKTWKITPELLSKVLADVFPAVCISSPRNRTTQSQDNNLEFMQVPMVFLPFLRLFLFPSLPNMSSSKSCFMKTCINFLKREVG